MYGIMWIEGIQDEHATKVQFFDELEEAMEAVLN